MTDDQSWHAPSGQNSGGTSAGGSAAGSARGSVPGTSTPAAAIPAAPAPYGQVPYGQLPYGQHAYGQAPDGQAPYGQAPYGQPQYAQQQYGQQQPAWTPPPKPGLIPLRPLGFGTLLGAPFQVLRRNPKATFGSALLVQALSVVLTLLVVGPVMFFAVDRIERATPSEFEAVSSGSTAIMILSVFIPVILTVLASALLQGVIVLEVARATLGEKLRLSTLWKAVFQRAWPLIGWIALLTLWYIVAIGIAVLIVVLLAIQGPALLGLTIGVGVILGIGLVFLLAWLTIKTSLTPCLIVLEKLPIGASIKRSWSLTSGYFWKTLGVQFLVGAIVSLVSQIVTTPFTLLSSFATTLFDPHSMLGTIGPAIASSLLLMLPSLIIGSIAIVAQSATVALIYIDLRMRKEGLDLELQRFVDDRETGANSVPDPYLAQQRRAPFAV